MKALFVGLGSIGQRHLRVFKKKFPSAEIHALRKSKRHLIIHDDLSTSEGDPIRHHDILEVESLAKARALNPDVVFITNPSSLHLRVAKEFLKSGTHLFIEKPLGSDLKEALKFQAMCRRMKSVVFLGYQFQFHPFFNRLQVALSQKTLGKICSVIVEVGEYVVTQHKYEDYRDTYVARKELGGGVILSQSHEIDAIIRLFGLPLQLVASSGHRSRLELDVEDTADVLCFYKNFSLMLHMDFLQVSKRRHIKVIGDEGTLEIDLISNQLRIVLTSGGIEEIQLEDFRRNSLFEKEQDLFFKRIEERDFGMRDVDLGVKGLRFCEAIKKSSRLKKACHF